MHIIIVGTGAVGGFYGGKLQQGGASVSAVCRSDYTAVVRDGIRIQSVSGDLLFRPDHVLKKIEDYQYIPDYIIVTTKALPDIDVPSMILSKVYPGTSIVLLQNGIEIDEEVRRAFPDNELISAMAFICVSRPGPGEVLHEQFGKIVIGRYPTGRSEKTELLADIFLRARIQCAVSEDIIAERWKKLVWNAPFNPISVLCRADTAKIMGSPELVELGKRIMEEVLLIAEAEGHPLPRGIIEQNTNNTVGMKPFKTSMLQDFENGRPMEVEAILGNAIRIAHRRRVTVPYMECLYGLMCHLNNFINASDCFSTFHQRVNRSLPRKK